MNLENHPCFNVKSHRTHGRVHLPVAPRCNIQCKFCNRKFDCVNESRPGVTSGILTPHQAMAYLAEVFAVKQNISVVGIAGPGDPFANPSETLETLELVKKTYPDVMLCVATNGLNILPYLDDLVRLQVSHVTVTVNAVDAEISSRIYSWVRYNRRVLRAEAGAKVLLENQMAAIQGLKERGIIVKINSIIIPGINDDHMEAIAKQMSDMDIDILNCVPYYPNQGSSFEHMEEPSKELVENIRTKAGKYVKQMHHCTRCRADAVGLLGEAPDRSLMNKLQVFEKMVTNGSSLEPALDRTRVAVASMEGVLVNQHLGEASQLLIYGKNDGRIMLEEARKMPPKGGGDQRWQKVAEILSDCQVLLVSGVGEKPRQSLNQSGIDVYQIEGLIDDALQGAFEGSDLRHMIRRDRAQCGVGCSGTGGGCG